MWCLPDYNRFVPDYTVHSDLRAAAGTAEESPSCMYKVRPDIYSGFPPVSLPLPGLLPELPAAVPEPELLPVRMPELPLHAVPLSYGLIYNEKVRNGFEIWVRLPKKITESEER